MINLQWGFNPIIIRMLFAVTLFQQQYLILEGLDVIGQLDLLADTKISTMAKPLNVVWMQIWCYCKKHYLVVGNNIFYRVTPPI
jgi:hypothetical protein